MALRGKKPSKAKPSRPCVLVLGAAGVGKTWTAIDFPSSYLIDSEGGANLPHYVAKLEAAKAQYMGPEDGASDFGEVNKEVLALRSQKHDRKTLIIDSITKLHENEVQAEVEKLQSKGKEPAFGSEKKPAIAKSRQLMARISKLDMNVILIAHEKAKWENGEQSGWTFDAHDKLGYEVNLVLRIVKAGNTRRALVVKSRFKEFEEGTYVDWCYETFSDAFGADVLEADSTPVEPASKEQLEELGKLIEVCLIDETTLFKWKDKAGVEKWADMDTDTIQKCIDYLRKQLPSSAA